MSSMSDFVKAMRKQVNGQRGGIRAAAKVKILQSPDWKPFDKKETEKIVNQAANLR